MAIVLIPLHLTLPHLINDELYHILTFCTFLALSFAGINCFIDMRCRIKFCIDNEPREFIFRKEPLAIIYIMKPQNTLLRKI